MYEKQIEKIPGFEITPDLHMLKSCTDIYRIAGLKTQGMSKKVAGAIKKLLDDRRQLTQLCLAMYRILFYPYEKNKEIFETDVWKILREVTGKSIDELLKKE